MKRFSSNELSYENAIKKVHLVERNLQPNQVNLVNVHRSAMHEEEDIIHLATQIQRADESIKNYTSSKLAVILEQIKMLQMQAKSILTEMEQNNELNHVPCNFVKKSGNIYHLYQKSSGAKYFSMLSEEDWNGACKDYFLGSFRFENDLSWTPLSEVHKKDEALMFTNKVIKTCVANNGANFLSIACNEMDVDSNS